MSQFVKKAKASESGPVDPVGGLDADWLKRHPALVEYLTLDRFDDGSRRETASITLFAGEGMLKACFNDRANRRMAFVSGSSPSALLGALERGLSSDSLEWREVKQFQRKGGSAAGGR